jgi:hypothetical protein
MCTIDTILTSIAAPDVSTALPGVSEEIPVDWVKILGGVLISVVKMYDVVRDSMLARLEVNDHLGSISSVRCRVKPRR